MTRRLHDHTGPTLPVEPPRPRPIPGATWQAGVTPGNEKLKVLLDGEPVLGAVAANEAAGWVDVQPEPQLQSVRCSRRAPLGLAYRVDPFAAPVRRTGRVELVPVGGATCLSRAARIAAHVRH